MQFPLVKLSTPSLSLRKEETEIKAFEKNFLPISALNLCFLAFLKLLRFWFTISLLSFAGFSPC
jgi:hypothetical protein